MFEGLMTADRHTEKKMEQSAGATKYGGLMGRIGDFMAEAAKYRQLAGGQMTVDPPHSLNKSVALRRPEVPAGHTEIALSSGQKVSLPDDQAAAYKYRMGGGDGVMHNQALSDVVIDWDTIPGYGGP